MFPPLDPCSGDWCRCLFCLLLVSGDKLSPSELVDHDVTHGDDDDEDHVRGQDEQSLNTGQWKIAKIKCNKSL